MKNKFLKLNFLSIIILLMISSVFAQNNTKILTLNTVLSTNGVKTGQSFTAAVVVDIIPPWHINSNKPLDEFSIATVLNIDKSNDFTISEIFYPEPVMKKLMSSGSASSLFEGKIIIEVIGNISDTAKDDIVFSGNLGYQGCNNSSCLAPNETKFSMKLKLLESNEIIKDENSEIFSNLVTHLPEEKQTDSNNNEAIFNVEKSFAQKGVFLTFLLIFLGGLGLNFTPCIYPLIPITMSYFGGQASNKKGKRIVLAVLYVLGIATINSTLGTVAALSGGLLGSFMQNPIVLIVIAGIMLTMAFSMFGFFEFGLPSFLTNLSGGSKSGYIGAFGMGLTMGLVAAPCIGPFVIGLLTYVAAVGNPFIGFSMFFTLSMGLGLPFVFLAFYSSKISSLPRAGDWMVGVRTIFGFILIGMALYFLHPLINEQIFVILFPVYLAITGVFLLLIDKSGKTNKVFFYFKQTIAIATIFFAGWFMKPNSHTTGNEMDWVKFSTEIFDSALESNSPVIIDFYANWCIPCKELDKLTFVDPEIVELSNEFTLLKVDLTSEPEGKIKDLKDRYNVKGVPTIIFIDKNGNELKKARTLGFVKPDIFIEKMTSTLNNK